MSKMADAGKKKGMELAFDGELTIQKVADLKEQLIAALDAQEGLIVNLKDVSKADLTILQLFCSAHRTAQKAGKFFKLINVSEAVDKAVTDVGFLRDNMACGQECDDSCLWVERES
jgi:anti-anti-sigma factor